MTTTALVIATRDRPQMLLQTVESAIKQSVPFTRIVISENSSSEEARQITVDALQPYLRQHPKKFFIVLPPPDLPSDEHTAYIQGHILGEEDYTVLFHDDDLMESTYHAALRQILDNNKDIVGVSCNARLLHGQDLTRQTTMGSWSGTLEIVSPTELLSTYMDFSRIGPPPLCGYMHRTSVLKQLSFSRFYGGKYSDVAALTQLVAHGTIMWLSTAQMQYRVHPSQNSQTVSTRDYRSLINYLVDHKWLPATSPLLKSYRFKHLRLKLRMMNKKTKIRSIVLVRRYLLSEVLFRYIFQPGFYLHLARLLFRS